jgi:hypothetical protein
MMPLNLCAQTVVFGHAAAVDFGHAEAVDLGHAERSRSISMYGLGGFRSFDCAQDDAVARTQDDAVARTQDDTVARTQDDGVGGPHFTSTLEALS